MGEADRDNNDDKQKWACPRCTLLNEISNAQCDACLYRNPEIRLGNRMNNRDNPGGVRRPDPVRRERLIDDNLLMEDLEGRGRGTAESAASYVGGGALLGGVLGAAAAYMRGRPVNSGAIEGAVSGAVSGAFVREVFRSQTSTDDTNENTNDD